jgi:cytochrome c oxidase subunit 1
MPVPLERLPGSGRFAFFTFWLMAAGLVLAAIPLLGNAARVMFTFYPPSR